MPPKFLVSRVHPLKLKLAIEDADKALKMFYKRLASLPAIHVKPELEKVLKKSGLTVYTTGTEYARSFFPLEKLGWIPPYDYHDDINKLLASLDVRPSKSIMDEIHKALEEGSGPPIDKLAPKLGYETAKSVARTVIMNIYVKGALNKWHEDGIEHVKRLAVEDLKTCPVCKGLNGKEYVVADLLELPNPQSFDTHENCLVGETVVLSPGTSRGRVGLYQGPGVKVVFQGGDITCTANHMFLTSKGFARASSLRNGDKILYSPVLERPSISNPDYDGKPAPIKDIVAALAESCSMSRRRVPISSKELHGDGAFFDSDIDVISANGFGWDAGKPSISQFGNQEIFDWASCPQRFSSERNLASMLFALRDASDGGVGVRGESEFFLRRKLGHSYDICLPTRPSVDSAIYQNSSYFCSAYIKQLGNSQLRLANNIFTDHGRIETSESLPELVYGFAGLIQTRKVLDVHSFHLSAPVYDLQTQSSLYIANGLVSSNCRCTYVPIINISTYAPKKDRIPLAVTVIAGGNHAEDVPIEYATVLQEALGRSRLPFNVKFDPMLKADYERRNGTLIINPKTLADEDPREIIYQEQAEELWPKVKARVTNEYAPLVRKGFARSARSWDDEHELFVNNFTAFKLRQLDNDLWSQVFFRDVESTS